jgi:hypothetical protein
MRLFCIDQHRSRISALGNRAPAADRRSLDGPMSHCGREWRRTAQRRSGHPWLACHQCPREHECVEGFTYLSPQAGPLSRGSSVCTVRQRGFLEASRCTTAIRAPGSCTKTGTSAPLDIPRLARPSGLMTGTAVAESRRSSCAVLRHHDLVPQAYITVPKAGSRSSLAA